MKPTGTSLKIKLIVGIALFILLKIGFDVFRVPNYSGSDAYVTHSPDGKYKAMTLFMNENDRNFWESFALSFGDYNRSVLFAIADASSGEILAFYHPPRFWQSSGSGGHWTCEKEGTPSCKSFWFSNYDDIQMPPPWWKRIHAKLTVKLKGLENPQFKEVTIEN